MTRILVAFQEGGTVPDNAAPATWNYSNDGSVGTKVADLLDSTGAATGISWAVGAGASFTELGSSGAFSSDHQGYAEECWETCWYASGDNDPIEFDGFPANQTGTLKFGAWTSSGRNTRLNDGQGNTATATAKSEPPNTVTTLNWQADGTGKLTISPEVVSNFVYIQFFDIEYTASASLAIDSEPTEVRATESFSIDVSNPATAPTTGNTTGNLNGLTGIAPDSVSGSGPYTITWTLPRTTAKLFDGTGYTFDIDIDGETVSTSTLPYLPQTDWDYITLATPDTGSEIYTQYSGTTPVATDQGVWETLANPDGATITVADDLAWTFTPSPRSEQTSGVYVIQADGTVGLLETITWTAPAGGGSAIPVESRKSLTRLIEYLKGEGYEGAGNEVIVNWLLAEGIDREQFNTMLDAYLGGLGYTGAFSRKLLHWILDS